MVPGPDPDPDRGTPRGPEAKVMVPDPGKDHPSSLILFLSAPTRPNQRPGPSRHDQNTQNDLWCLYTCSTRLVLIMFEQHRLWLFLYLVLVLVLLLLNYSSASCSFFSKRNSVQPNSSLRSSK